MSDQRNLFSRFDTNLRWLLKFLFLHALIVVPALIYSVEWSSAFIGLGVAITLGFLILAMRGASEQIPMLSRVFLAFVLIMTTSLSAMLVYSYHQREQCENGETNAKCVCVATEGYWSFGRFSGFRYTPARSCDAPIPSN